MIGFNQNKKGVAVAEEKVAQKVESENNTPAVILYSKLATRRLAYTVKDSYPFAEWVKENIEDPDVDPIVVLSSDCNDEYLMTTITAGVNTVSEDLPADYVQGTAQSKAVSTANKIEVNIL